MTTANQKVTYTAEQTAQLLADWNEGKGMTIEALATKFGKSAKSIISKLSREKVYTAKTYTTKTGEKPVKKDETADLIGNILGMPENDIDSLTKANKTALVTIKKALISSVPLEVLTPENEVKRDDICTAIGETFGMSTNETNSLKRVPMDALIALYDGIQAFDFLNDVRSNVDDIVAARMNAINKEIDNVNAA